MPTDIETLKTRIAEREGWLKFNHAEHLSVVSIQTDLRKLKEQLAELESNRSFERNTFDIREHKFKTAENEGK
jgi:hypothetical protein